MEDIFLLLINILVVLGLVLYLFSRTLIKEKKVYLERVKKKQKTIENNSYRIFKYCLILKSEYEKIIGEKKELYKTIKANRESDYFKGFIYSTFISMFISLNFWVVGEILIGAISFLLVYLLVNFLYLKYLKRKIDKYKIILTNEAIGVMQQFGLHYAFIKNPIRVINDILIPKNKNREISRQLEKMVQNIMNSPKSTPVEVVAKFKKSLNGVIGMEVFLTLIQNTLEQGVISEKEITAYSSNLIEQKKLDKEKKIKETISLLEIILIVFFIIPISIILMLPTLLQKNGDFNLLDIIRAIIKF